MPYKDPLVKAAYAKEHRLANPEMHRASWHKYSAKIREQCFALFSNKCARCSFADSRAFQIDHIYGGGNQERKTKLPGGHRLYKAIVLGKRSIEDLQLLCANCNIIKRVENKEY